MELKVAQSCSVPHRTCFVQHRFSLASSMNEALPRSVDMLARRCGPRVTLTILSLTRRRVVQHHASSSVSTITLPGASNRTGPLCC